MECPFNLQSSIFKVPHDFSVTYWDDTGFIGYNSLALCYDVERANLVEIEFPGGYLDGEVFTYKLYHDANVGGYKIIVACAGTHVNAGESLDKLYKRFLCTGRCVKYDPSQLDEALLFEHFDEKTLMAIE